jgi:hypothetical protein
MRKLIAAFETSVDGKIEGPDGFADWVEAWSEDPAHRVSADCRQGQAALRHDGPSSRARAAQVRAASGWASEPDLQPALSPACNHREWEQTP